MYLHNRQSLVKDINIPQYLSPLNLCPAKRSQVFRTEITVQRLKTLQKPQGSICGPSGVSLCHGLLNLLTPSRRKSNCWGLGSGPKMSRHDLKQGPWGFLASNSALHVQLSLMWNWKKWGLKSGTYRTMSVTQWRKLGPTLLVMSKR